MKLIHEIDLTVNVSKEDFRERLNYNVANRHTSFIRDLFSSDGHKYSGIIEDSHFKLKFPKSIYRPELFSIVINGSYSETNDGLQVKIAVSSINRYTKTH